MAGSLGQGNSQVHPQSLGVVTAARFVLWAVTWDSYTPPVKNLRNEREQTPALLRLAYATLWTALIMVQSAKITLEYRITRLRALGRKWKYLEPLTWKKKLNLESALCILRYIKIKWIWNGKSRKSTIWLGFNTDGFSAVKVVSRVRISEPSFLCTSAQFKNVCLAKITTIARGGGGYFCWCVPDVSFQELFWLLIVNYINSDYSEFEGWQ